MTRGSAGPGPPGQQVNFTLDAHWRLVLRLAAEADGVSVPELVRPLVVRYLKQRLKNEDLAEAVRRIEKVRGSRAAVPDNVSDLPAQRKHRARPARPKSDRTGRVPGT